MSHTRKIVDFHARYLGKLGHSWMTYYLSLRHRLKDTPFVIQSIQKSFKSYVVCKILSFGEQILKWKLKRGLLTVWPFINKTKI